MNTDFAYWFDRCGLSKKEFARRVAQQAQTHGLPHVRTAASRVRGWLTGQQPVELAEVIAEVVTEACGEPVRAADLGFRTARPSDDRPVADALDRHCRADLIVRKAIDGAGSVDLVSGPTLVENAERVSLGRSVVPMTGGRVGGRHVAQVSAATTIFRQWDNTYGGGLRRKAVVGQLSEVVPLLHGPFTDERTGCALFAAVADLAQLAGWMSFDLALDATAQRYYLLALRLASDAGDRAQVARMLYCLARQMIELDRPRDALDLTGLALYVTHRARMPRVTAMLRVMEGRAYACLGDATGCDRALGLAADAFSSNGSDPAWSEFFDETELAGVTGVALRDLAVRDSPNSARHAARARPWIAQAATGRSRAFLRSRVLDLAGLALVDLLLDEPHAALSSGRQALEQAGAVNSSRVERNLSQLAATAADRYPSIRAVREFDGRVRKVLPG